MEKKFTSLSLNAFTVDPYRFRVSLDNEIVTDSLWTPEGQISKEIFFNDYHQRIRVYNTSDETLLIDTPYTLSVGKVNAFTIYQTQAGAPPFCLVPSPSEPMPATGNTKLSIICSGAQLSDSVRVIVETQTSGGGSKPRDTAVVKKDNLSRYFEVAANKNITVYIYRMPGNEPLGNKIFSGNDLNADFSIYRLTYNGTSSLVARKLY